MRGELELAGHSVNSSKTIARKAWYDEGALSNARYPGVLGGCLFELLEATPGLVMVSNRKGRLLYMNAMGRVMLGVEQNDDLVNQSIKAFYPAPAYEHFLDEAVPTCLRAGSWRGETTLVDRNEEEIPVSQVLTAHHVKEQTHGNMVVLSGIAWDMREHKQIEAVLRHQATHDALTGLPNRALLLDRLTQAIHSAQRHGHLVAVLFLDVDDFKSINDDHGHESANLVLRDLGHRLDARVRAEDTVARYGGDEFVLLVPGLAAESDVERIVGQAEQALEEPFALGNESCQVSASVGVAIYPNDGEDVTTLLQKADSMMYRKKGRPEGRSAPRGSARPLRGIVLNRI